MANQRNRGVSKALANIIGAMKPHEQISADSNTLALLRRAVPGANESSLVSGLYYLMDKGVLATTAVRGVYEKPNGATKPAVTDMETVVIDNLLNAMAEAEPVLKRCKKMLEAFRAVG